MSFSFRNNGASGCSGGDQTQTTTRLFIPRQPCTGTAFAAMSVSDNFHTGLRAGHRQNAGQNDLLSLLALALIFHIANKKATGRKASLVS